ncbi:hypothetical protein [Billgrantia endophytica]|uniref:hypothetical protein n=1 Tax=Billgrantia endophytica TaxID=2033802 RepID=UPI001056A8C2|nr:hypothetical protein [Halomonas endophytica]
MKNKKYRIGALIGGIISLVVSFFISLLALSYSYNIQRDPYSSTLEKVEEFKNKNEELKGKISKQGEMIIYNDKENTIECHIVKNKYKTLFDCESDNLDSSMSFAVNIDSRRPSDQFIYTDVINFDDYHCDIDGKLNDHTLIKCLFSAIIIKDIQGEIYE